GLWVTVEQEAKVRGLLQQIIGYLVLGIGWRGAGHRRAFSRTWNRTNSSGELDERVIARNRGWSNCSTIALLNAPARVGSQAKYRLCIAIHSHISNLKLRWVVKTTRVGAPVLAGSPRSIWKATLKKCNSR